MRVGGRARSARLRRRRSFGWRAGWPLRPPVLGASPGARPFSSSHARLWCAILSEEGPRPGGPTVEAVRASPQRPLTARDRGTPTGRQAPGACRSGATCGSRGRTSGPYSKVARPSGAQVISQTPRFRWPRLPVGSGGVHRPADLRRRGAGGFDLLSLCARESPQVAFDAPLSVVSGRHRLGRVVGRRQGVEVGLELLVRVEDLARGSRRALPLDLLLRGHGAHQQPPSRGSNTSGAPSSIPRGWIACAGTTSASPWRKVATTLLWFTLGSVASTVSAS